MADLQRLKALMEEKKVDLLIVSSPENIFYLTNFPTHPSCPNRGAFLSSRLNPGSMFCIITKHGESSLILPRGFASLAKKYATVDEIKYSSTGMYIESSEPLEIFAPSSFDALVKLIEAKGFSRSRFAVEKSGINALTYERLKERLTEAKFLTAEEILWKLRMIKSELEITRIRQAVKGATEAYRAAIERIGVGVEEREILSAYTSKLFTNGFDWNTTTVGAGPNGAEPYHIPSDYKLRRGDIVFFDCGAAWQGYCADLARCASVGKPSEKVTKIYSTLCEAQQEVIDLMEPGVEISKLYHKGIEVVRKVLPQYWRGNIGHSIGVVVHEYPDIAHNTEEKLRPNMILAVELPVYIEGSAGFNIESNVLITKTKHEILDRNLPRELFICEK